MGQQADRAAKFFANELSWIKKPEIRQFVLDAFDKICPDYFWERPAAKRGGYHPGFTDGDGGLCRHVKYACWWGNQLCRAFSGNGQGEDVGPLHDVVIAALILHDVVKDGDAGRSIPKSPFPMGRYHGVEMMEALFHRVLNAQQPTEDQLLIMAGVAAHMGVWTEPEKFRPWNLGGSLIKKVATLVHMADYCASRKVDEVIPKLAGQRP
jgi:hypothetical protein